MKNINIELYNYSESEFTRTRRHKNLKRILFAFSQVIYAFYVNVLSFIISRVPLKKQEIVDKFISKFVLNRYLNSDYFYEGRIQDLKQSFNLEIGFPSYYESYLKTSVTKSGLIELVKYKAFFRRCVEIYYEEDFCHELIDSVEYKIGDIDDNIINTNESLFSDISMPMQIVLYIKNSTNNRYSRLVLDKVFIDYATSSLSNFAGFLHLEGIYVE